MKITNEGHDAREYPTLGVILQAGESFDDAKAKVHAVPTAPIAPSAASDSTEEEVK
jgi:hypothetical protein